MKSQSEVAIKWLPGSPLSAPCLLRDRAAEARSVPLLDRMELVTQECVIVAIKKGIHATVRQSYKRAAGSTSQVY